MPGPRQAGMADDETDTTHNRTINLVRRKRRAHRLSIQNACKTSEQIMVELRKEGFTKDSSEELILELEALLLEIEESKMVVSSYDQELMKVLEDEIEINEDVAESAIERRKAQVVVMKIKKCLTKQNEEVSEIRTRKAEVTSIKLPKIQLKKFSGDPVEWKGFFDTFEAAVDKHEGLSEVEKFSYMKGLLEGKAASTVAGMSLSNENYKQAIQLLQERFGNTQVIISAHMDALLKIVEIKGCSQEQELRQLRGIYDKIETHVRGLQSLGIGSTQYGSLLTPVVLSKIPEEMRLHVTRKFKDTYDFDQLLESFKEELQIRERCTSVSIREDKFKRKPHFTERTDRDPTTRLLMTLQKDQMCKDGKLISCTYCRKNHRSMDCDVLTDASTRKEFIKRAGRCFICLRKGHTSRVCQSDNKCLYCSRKHHSSICLNKQEQETREKENPGRDTVMLVDSEVSVILQTATVNVVNPENGMSLPVKMILDLGSHKSYITQLVVDRLKVKDCEEKDLYISTFGDETPTKVSTKIVSLQLQGVSAPIVSVNNVRLHTVPHICRATQAVKRDSIVKDSPQFKGLQFADNGNFTGKDIEVLIGADNYHQIVTGEIVRANGPVATKTRFGWVLSGPMKARKMDQVDNLLISCELERTSEGRMEEQLRRFWDLETIGVRPHEDEEVFINFKETLRFENSRYEVKLPWKSHRDSLTTNFELCKVRLQSLLKRLKKRPSLLKEYDKIFQEQEKAGIIENIPKTGESEGIVHYLPHHCVIKKNNETTKLRVVFDASARDGSNPSLNDCLHSGPSLIVDIFGILLRFRMYEVAITADIEKAFLMVSIAPEDRNALRFLWIDDYKKDFPEIVEKRQTRVTFGVNSSPFLLGGTVGEHVHSDPSANMTPEFAERFLRSLYVDDLTRGESTINKAVSFYFTAKKVMQGGSFNLRKWRSNSPELMNLINQLEGSVDPSEEPTFASMMLEFGNKYSEGRKILGLNWQEDTDEFVFNFKTLVNEDRKCELTKRCLVSSMSKMYDPLGLLTPLFVRMKILVQRLCKEKVNWDDPLTEELDKEYKEWLHDITDMESIRINRRYFESSQHDDMQIHTFADASSNAYAAATYMRVVEGGNVKTRLIASKSRVAPLRTNTIPRLELLAALVAARLGRAIQAALETEFPVNSMYFWSDSLTALFWINRSKEMKQFVENRVAEIRRLTDVNSWNHCPGKDNPADIPSRGCKARDLDNNLLWWNGPAWLKKDSSEWPKREEIRLTPKEAIVELKRDNHKDQVLFVGDNEIIKKESYSSLSRLLRVTGWTFRFMKNLQYKRKGIPLSTGELTSRELCNVELFWVREAQKNFQAPGKLQQLKKSLNMYIDEHGVYRSDGRIRHAHIEEERKSPIILPKDDHFSKLVVLQAHHDVMHLGVEATLDQVRSKYWVIKGRQVVKMLIRLCRRCQQIQGKPFSSVKQPDLPMFRVTLEKAFDNVGVDFAGPLLVQERKHGQSSSKAWITLYTCAASRAVHLELVQSLSTDSFISCFRRIISRRGLSCRIYSDNAKTFKSAEKRILLLMNDPGYQSFLSKNRIIWEYILPKASWWGGFYERMIQTTKRVLKKILGRARLTLEELQTTLAEIEAVLNSRPLTYSSAEDISTVITSHLVNGKRLISLPQEAIFKVTGAENSRSEIMQRQDYVNSRPGKKGGYGHLLR